jgi:hypothetical protein
MRSRTRCFLTLASVTLSLTAIAQPVPKLNSLSQEWIQRGQTVRLSVAGDNLADAAEVLISGAPGLSAKLVNPPQSKIAVESSGGGISAVTPRDGKNLMLEIEVGAEVPLTERELRIATPSGVSNPLNLRVGHLPEARSEGKNTRETAQSLKLPVAVNGVLGTAAESHFFSFTAKKGERVVLEVFAARDGSKLDSSLAVLDKAGKELIRNEDAAGLDSVVEFTAPEDGEYIAELRDFRYQGAGDYKYRLIAGVLPYVASAFPFGGQRGQTVELALRGSNLEGASKLTVQLEKNAATGRQELRAANARGLSNPFPFDVSDLPNRSESEPNSALDQADAIPIPVAVNGRIGARKDYDAFRFEAAKDQRIVFEAHAFRFGSRLDALLTLTDERGNVLQRNDDSDAVDARIDYTFRNPGAHFIIIEDLLARGGDDFPYRLTATVPQPAFAASALQDTPRIRRGGHVPVRVEIARMNGFGEAVKIVCEELPTGVFAEPLVIAPGQSAGALLLTATPEAPLGTAALKIVAVTSKGRQPVQAFAGDRAVKQAFLTVLEAAPFSVSSGSLLGNFEQHQTGTIDVVVERRAGFGGEIRVTAEAFSPARDSMTRTFEYQPLVLKAGETSGKLSLRVKSDAELGARALVLKAESGEFAAHSQPVPVSIAEIPFTITPSLRKLLVTALPESAGSAASEAAFTVKASRRMGFAGELALTLEGVPEGVTATVEKIAANGSEAAIKLVASEKAETGKDHNITITAVGAHNDRTYRFKAAPIVLTVNAPEKEAEAKIAAKP